MKSKASWIIALLFLLFLHSCNKSESANPSDPFLKKELLSKLRHEMEINGMTSMSFAVVKEDKLILSDALGYAGKRKKIYATTDTRYLVASVSKPVTCTALMQLYEKNLFSLDDDINEYLPFSVRNPRFPDDKITFRMLLSHRSGLSDDYMYDLNLYCYGYDCEISLEDYIKAMLTKSGEYYSLKSFSNSKPGTAEDYSNLGIALAGYLVERISGKPFDKYCEENIFIPLGMNRTEWRLSKIPRDELAVPDSEYLDESEDLQYTFPDYPDGGLRTTVTDMSKFLRAFINQGSFNGQSILFPSTTELMKTLQYGSRDQAIIFFYKDVNGRRLLGHDGSEMGVSTEMFFDPETNTGVIIFNNNDDTDLDNSISLLLDYAENVK